MSDDQFSRELLRRAAAADVPDLLPAVRSAIDTRPAPVTASRLAPAAGLVGILAVLLLLVVARPNLGPGDAQPSSSDGPVSADTRLQPQTSPPPPTSQPSPASFKCGPGTDLRDHTAVVGSCEAETDRSVPTGDLTVSGDGDGVLLVTWPVVLDNCTLMHSQLDLWGGPEPGQYALEIRMRNPNRAPFEPDGPLCDMATGVHTARLTLSQRINPADVDANLTLASLDATHSSSFAEMGDNWFEMSIGASKVEYSSGEAIDVWGSLMSDNDVTLMCLFGPIISMQQLDGPLTFTPGPFALMCPGPRELRSHEPFTNGFLPAVWALSDPHPLDPYIRDGELYLPPGTYRFTARSSFDFGETRNSQLEASIVVTVR